MVAESQPSYPTRVVPAYALTGGRTRSTGPDLPLETMVSSTPDGLRELTALRFETREIVLLCRRAQSIAEVAARVKIPLGVARVLVSDLTEAGMLAIHRPEGDRPDRATLERLLSGLRSR